MKDDYCVFVILASMVAVMLPPGGALVYVVFAASLVWLAGIAGGIERGEPVTEPSGSTSATSPPEPQ